MLSILHMFVQHDTWTKIPWKMELNQTDWRRRRAHFPIDQPAAHLLRAQRTSPSQESRKELRSAIEGGREGKREIETEKESTESSCLLLPDAPKGARSCSFFWWAVRLSQAAIDELCSCLPLQSPIPLWMASQETETGRKERLTKYAVKIWRKADKTKWSKAER